MEENGKKHFFYDKRDAEYVQLSSPYYFYEMFVRKKIKSTVIIPATIIFNKGAPRLWLFNSKKQSGSILKKNSDKLNPSEIVKSLCRIKSSDDYRLDQLSTLLELIKNSRQQNEVAAFLRYSGSRRKTMTRLGLVKAFLENKENGLSIIQEHVENQSKANEIYYIEYRRDSHTMPVNLRFFKKSQTSKAVVRQKKAKDDDENPFNELISLEVRDKEKEVRHEKVTQMFKLFDTHLNAKFTDIAKSLVDFVERSYRVHVKKAVAKFIIDHAGTIFFLGLKELYIDFGEQPYNVRAMKDELKDVTNNSFENFKVLCKLWRKRDGREKILKLPEIIYEDEKEISAKLYKNLIVEKCVGDFCEFVMVEKNRGPLAIRKNILEDYKKHFGDKKMNEENFSVTLPYEISYQLILRTRECAEEIIEILKKNKIFSRNSNHHFTNEEYMQDFDASKEYPFKKSKTIVYNMGNLYKNVKICKNCFIVYSLTSKYFDNRLKNDLKNKSWRAQTALGSLSKQPTLGVGGSEHVPATAPAGMQRRKQTHEKDDALSGTHQKRKTTQEDVLSGVQQKRKHTQDEQDQEPDDHSQANSQSRIVKSASQDRRIRITRNTNPKMYKLYMPQKALTRQCATSQSQRQIPNTKKQIDINRLAMGFLNYHKPPLPKEPQHTESNAPVTSQMQQSLVTHAKQPQIRKTLQLQENKQTHQQNTEKRNIRKKCTNDQQTRAKLQEYYQQKVINGDHIEYQGPTSVYSYHTNFQHLRLIPETLLTTPIKALIEGQKQNWLNDVDLGEVCRLTANDYPPVSIPEHLVSQINYFIFDDQTAIPYIILFSPKSTQTYQEFEQGVFKQGDGQVIVFLADFFDNAFEYITIFDEALNHCQNTAIVIMNIPGQAYTVYNEQRVYHNLMIAEMVDRLLFHLNSTQTISLHSDNLKLIGIGYGGFLLQTFLSFADGNLPFIQSIQLINSFGQLDDMLKDTLLKSKEVFQTCPPDMAELAYNYYSVISNSNQLNNEQLELKMQFNPISLSGRINIIDGCLQSQSTIQQFNQIPIDVEIWHTLKNCVVNINQTDVLAKKLEDMNREQKEKLVLKRIKPVPLNLKKINFIDGGHSILDENPSQLMTILTEFIKS